MTRNKPAEVRTPYCLFCTVSSSQADTLLFVISLILKWATFYILASVIINFSHCSIRLQVLQQWFSLLGNTSNCDTGKSIVTN